MVQWPPPEWLQPQAQVVDPLAAMTPTQAPTFEEWTAQHAATPQAPVPFEQPAASPMNLPWPPPEWGLVNDGPEPAPAPPQQAAPDDTYQPTPEQDPFDKWVGKPAPAPAQPPQREP